MFNCYKKRPIRPPNLLLTMSEVPRSMVSKLGPIIGNQIVFDFPPGDGHPVLVIPGFRGDDSYNQPLISFINGLGYYATGWNLGRNLGHGLLDPEILISRVNDLYTRTQHKVTLIGHSLGGIYAREIARLWPHEVRQVITLASPLGEGRGKASYMNYLYRKVSPHRGDDDESLWSTAPPVPTTAVYSRSDGILDWRVSLQSIGHTQTENIEVYSSHNGITTNPAVWYVIADRLTPHEGEWKPFDRSGWRRFVYPKPAWQPTETPVENPETAATSATS